jgi:hypothetical protein
MEVFKMYISSKNYDKFVEALMEAKEKTADGITKMSQEMHMEPIERSKVIYILNHSKQMKNKFGFINIQSI